MGDRHPDRELSAFLDDELDDASALRVAHHVASCRPCMAELEGLRAARAALRALPAVSPPDELFAGVPDAARSARSSRRTRLTVSSILVAALTLLVVAFAAGGDDGDVVPPVDVVVVDHVVRTGDGPLIAPVDLSR